MRALAAGSAVRRRLPVVLDDTRVAWVSDADGDDALDVLDLDSPTATPQRLVAPGRVGRVLEMAASPDGRRIALATHDGRLLTCNVPSGEISRTVSPKEIDTTVGDMSGLAFSPDSRWLAWSSSGPGPWEDPGPRPLRQIKVADLDRGRVIPVTSLRFTDTNPVFTRDGKHLAFLSIRSLDPMYDTFSFDLAFPAACRPHLVALATDDALALRPRRRRTALGAVRAGAGGSGSRGRDHGGGVAPVRRSPSRRGPRSTPRTWSTASSRFRSRRGATATWQPSKHGLVWIREPLRGELGDNRADVEAEPEAPASSTSTCGRRSCITVADKADRLEVTGDGSRVIVVHQGKLAIQPSDKPAPKEETPGSDDRVQRRPGPGPGRGRPAGRVAADVDEAGG